MGLREDYAKQQGKAAGRPAANASNYDPRSTTLLQSQLRKVASTGNPGTLRQAAKIAKGGGGSWSTRALGDTLSAIGMPMRGIAAGLDEALGAITRTSDKATWLQKVKDPTYGTGRIVEHYLPHLDWAPKVALGLAGDVLLDPLTYLTAGMGPTIEAVGKGAGMARIALQGSKYAEEIAKVAEVGGREAEAAVARKSAEELGRIATKSNAGKALADEELRHIEKATQFMASDPRGVVAKAGEQAALPSKSLTEVERMFGTPLAEMEKGSFAGVRKLADESLQYGIRAGLPFTEKGVMVPGTAGFGRALSEVGGKISAVVGEKTAKAFGGQLAGIKAAMRSEDPELSKAANALNDAVRRGRAAKNAVEREAGEATGRAVETLTHLGVSGEDLMRALSERPMTSAKLAEATKGMTAGEALKWVSERGDKVAGGQAWRDLIESAGGAGIPAEAAAAGGGPITARVAEAADVVGRREKLTKALGEVSDFYDSIPEGSVDAARAQGVERQFIGDAATGGRTAYVPRTLSEEFKQWLIEKGRGAGGQKIRPKPGEESWFMKKALNVGDKVGEGEAARELVDTGLKTPLYPEGAPGLETQIHDALGALYQDAAVPWYEPDFYKSHAKYIQGLGHQVESQTIQNTLLARGISRPTIRAAIQDAAEPSLWRPEMFGEFDPAKGGRTSFSGKVLNDVEYGKFQEMLRQGDPGVMAVKNQWGDNLDEAIAHVDHQLSQLHLEMDQVGLLDQAHLDRLAEQERLWTGVKDQWQEAIGMAADDPARDPKMLSAARDQIKATIYGHEATWATMTKDETFIKRMSEALSQGYEGYGFARQAPHEVVDLLRDIAATYGSSDNALNDFLTKHYDPVNHWLKGWLTTSPGFLERNIFGGTFNNWLARVRNPAWTTIKVGKLLRNAERDFGEQAMHDVFDHAGVLNSGFFTSDLGSDPGGRLLDLGTGPGRAWSLNPAAGIAGGDKQPLLPFMNRRLNERFVEPMLRGTLVYDRTIKAVEQGRFASIGVHSMEDITSKEIGDRFVQEVRDSGLLDEVLSDVAKYHFDYEDLNRFERQVGRRTIPFYTWTRKNIPLQLEAMFTQPGKTLAAYGHVKRNLEGATPQQDVVPQWFGTAGLARLPWSDAQGQKYGGIDLPFKDVFDALDVTGQGLGMVSPLIKAPIETRMGSQFFGDLPLRDDTQAGGLKPMPTTWKWMIPFLVAADKLPFSPLHAPVKGKNGQYLMREDDNYLVQQYIPFMAQAQRLFPLEEGKYRNRLMSTWVSYLAGVQLRTNTPQDMENEVFRRSDQLSGLVNRLKVSGDIPTTASKAPKRQGPPLSQVIASLNTG